MKKIKLLLKIGKFICIAILVVVLLLNIASIVKRVVFKEQIPLVLGFGSAVIITGSMEPIIGPGDMIIIHQQNNYEVDDIVTYGSNTPITHRIVEKTPGGYIMQGDANNTDDGEIEAQRIIGKVVFVVPGVGNIILFFQSTLGMLVLILGVFALIEVPRLLAKNRHDT